MKKTKWIIPMVLFIVSLILLFRPAGRITFDKSVSENRILFQYEVFGCGSIIKKVLDGGEEITAGFKEQYPDIGTNEVALAPDSNEPMDQMFLYGTDYTFIIEGTPVGVTKGAPDCCNPQPAYNEHVVEFMVDRWYFTSYVPFIAVGDFGGIILGFSLAFIAIAWLVILVSIILCKNIIRRINSNNTKS